MSTLKTDAIEAATGTNTNLALTGKGTGKVAIGDAALLFPDADGSSSGDVLQTNASGVLSFATPAAGGFTLGTPVATTSGTSITFSGIPSGTKMIIVNFRSMSVASGTAIYCTIGDAGGLETAAYLGTTANPTVQGATSILMDTSTGTVASSVANFPIGVKDAGGYMNGTLTLTLQNSSTYIWVCSHMIQQDAGTISTGVGSKALSAELTQLQIAGNTFDLGEINIMYSS